MRRENFDDVKKAFEDKGYTLLENSYKNIKTKMKYICPNHPDQVQEIKYLTIKGGGGCNACGYERMGKKRRLSFEEVKNRFEKLGLVLLETHYVNSETPMKYKCPKHPNIIQTTKSRHIKQGIGCPICSNEKFGERKSGSNTHFWKGGVSELNGFLRDRLKGWKKRILNQHDNTCFLTGTKENLQVHHINPFHVIRDEVLNELGYELHEKISDYSNDQLKNVRAKFLQRHRKEIGYPLAKEIHKEFHSRYGYETTIKEFEEFAREFSEIKR